MVEYTPKQFAANHYGRFGARFALFLAVSLGVSTSVWCAPDDAGVAQNVAPVAKRRPVTAIDIIPADESDDEDDL